MSLFMPLIRAKIAVARRGAVRRLVTQAERVAVAMNRWLLLAAIGLALFDGALYADLKISSVVMPSSLTLFVGPTAGGY